MHPIESSPRHARSSARFDDQTRGDRSVPTAQPASARSSIRVNDAQSRSAEDGKDRESGEGECERTRLSCLWDEVGALICRAIKDDAYERWFEEIELVSLAGSVVTFEVPNSIYPLWIEMNYQREVIAAFAAVTGETVRLEFRIGNPSIASADESDEPDEEAAVAGTMEAPIDADDEDDEDGQDSRLVRQRGRADRAASGHAVTDRVLEKSGILPKFAFEGFVVGESNRYAHAAAKAVAEAPGRSYNPLFFHASAGLGKTHLLHAIGLAVLERNPRARVLYRTSEEWANEFIEAIERRSLSAFRGRYRNIDVLLLDDVQFFAGKDHTKSEFFHTFNTLFDGHKQIVLSSDRPASEIRNIEPRLRSRFDCGLTAELVQPNRETRLAILRSKAQRFSAQIEPEVFEFLADRVTSDIRTLEGALVRVASYIHIAQARPSLSELEHQLRDVINARGRGLEIDDIQRVVVEHFDLRLADMTSKDRRAAIAYPRQVAMLLARRLTDSTLKEIGDAFGGRDHGTVMHAVRKLDNLQGRDRDNLEQHISSIRRCLDGV